MEKIFLKDEYIKLGQALKKAGLVGSGVDSKYVITEGKVDFDALRLVLGDEVETSKEKYEFKWKGKAESIRLAQKPSSSTLRPVKGKSKKWDTTENLYIEGDNLEVLKEALRVAN